MGHLTFELILWLLLAFFIGCTLGYLLRKLRGGSSVVKESPPAPQPVAVPVAAPVAAVSPQVEKQAAMEPAAAATGVAKRPKGLAAARDGKADKLQRISGIGPKLDKTLNSLGYFHFDQISAWTPDEVQWVDEHLRFKGRIDRDKWIPQAKLLAAGDEEKFASLYGPKNKKT